MSYSLNRETYKRLKKSSWIEMQSFLRHLYTYAFMQGIAAEPNIEYRCGNCNKELFREDYKYCPYCAAELIWDVEAENDI